MQTGISVSEAMSTRPVGVRPGTSVLECSRVLREHAVGCLLVLEGAAALGIITERDIVWKVIATARDTRTVTAREIMTAPVEAIAPERDIYDAIVLMKNLEIRHLPVMDQGRVVGVLSVKDILRLEPALFEVLEAVQEENWRRQ